MIFTIKLCQSEANIIAVLLHVKPQDLDLGNFKSYLQH